LRNKGMERERVREGGRDNKGEEEVEGG